MNHIFLVLLIFLPNIRNNLLILEQERRCSIISREHFMDRVYQQFHLINIVRDL